ncbi:MAG TPA: hypothetical protein VGE38_16435 [Nocardioides sp.]|uniref:hypothetical protein n=1 Tax=Nocardioides sp. TaxID=35761 RepID=UPI002EDA2154
MSCLLARPASTHPIDGRQIHHDSRPRSTRARSSAGSIPTPTPSTSQRSTLGVGIWATRSSPPPTPTGYRQALDFLTGHGELTAIGIEGTSSYGIGITRTAREAGFEVFEAVRPERSIRRREGKSDPIDAYQAPHAVLAGRATAAAKAADITALRALHNAPLIGQGSFGGTGPDRPAVGDLTGTDP